MKLLISLLIENQEVNVCGEFNKIVKENKVFVKSLSYWLKKSLSIYVNMYPDFIKKIGY